ncbi:Kunitz family serine protease inhibitor, partial [Klebsiella pneumoniae]|uniref:Kunitz family serine protease inhibitor n=1 Tax=Klebsiella pneumoniae TaxID=573 RepID=UPI0037BF0732
MKTPFVTTVLFLLFALATKPLVGRQDSVPLVDVNGKEVKANQDYYIVSAIWGAGGGGLNLSPGRNELCPLDVFQEGSDMQRGSPLRFSAHTNTDIIYEAMDLNVKFSTEKTTRCNEPTVWKVDNYDESRGEWFVTTGGVEGNPGRQTLQNWFKFERIGSTLTGMYKIVHCPSVCKSCVHLCENVG